MRWQGHEQNTCSWFCVCLRGVILIGLSWYSSAEWSPFCLCHQTGFLFTLTSHYGGSEVDLSFQANLEISWMVFVCVCVCRISSGGVCSTRKNCGRMWCKWPMKTIWNQRPSSRSEYAHYVQSVESCMTCCQGRQRPPKVCCTQARVTVDYVYYSLWRVDSYCEKFPMKNNVESPSKVPFLSKLIHDKRFIWVKHFSMTHTWRMKTEQSRVFSLEHNCLQPLTVWHLTRLSYVVLIGRWHIVKETSSEPYKLPFRIRHIKGKTCNLPIFYGKQLSLNYFSTNNVHHSIRHGRDLQNHSMVQKAKFLCKN